ncbi:fibronectin-like [Periophthalmus magnuspinnatus]|uniref:fibronectin-like n=1 Tax=Periophthalmus magnuspinnatus TaxID=409849 RepID=UPI002436E796|nr:fibronectin-like [Periophthalmus magnuspinnatus]
MNLSSEMDCGSSRMSISWADSDGADSYLATVVDSYGQITSCQATTEGQCSVGALGCGLIYHVSLVASDGHCESQSTDAVDTPSVPCAPEHIKAMFDCQLNTALVTWYPSHGAVLYIVTATAASGDISSCQTDSTTHCELDELECGDSYSIQVLAVGETCNTTGHMSGEMETGPCPPEILSTEYSVTIGQVVWAHTLGAEYYTVEAVTDRGLVSQCQTNDTYCPLHMECSQTYTVTLTANNDDTCSSGVPSNETASIITEPCPPQNFQTSVRCEINSATASWEPSVGAVSYKTTLSGRNGKTLWCQTDNTFCELPGLECGVIYYANVVAMGDTLNSTESGTVQLEAAPCPVENVLVDGDWYNSSAVLSWSPASGAVSYKMIATATSGHQVSCESTSSECELEELEDGQTYTIKAVSINDKCSVETDTGVIFKTRPSKPQGVGADFLCDKDMAMVFWKDEDGVDMYKITVVSSSGVTSEYNSTKSPYMFDDFDCGETYNFSVKACNSMSCSKPSKTVHMETGPCQPTNLTVSSSCNKDTVVLSWSDVALALWYEVDVTGVLGSYGGASLKTNSTTVEINLPCGLHYTFTVQALGQACVSPVSKPVHHNGSPCVPWNVQSYTSCEDSIGTVSWAPTDGAEYYIAFAVGLDGHSGVCTTNKTSCIWNDLQCGDLYTVFVTAHNDACDSMQSNSTTIRMASCIPQNLSVDFNCSMKVGHLSWDAVDTADFYIATAETNSGHKIQQTTNDTWVYFSEFLCGEEYFLSVQSVDAHCTSKPSPAAKLQSEPCPPTGVSSFMNCVANIAVVSWNRSAGADYYTATVMSEEGTSHSCWSDNDQCGIPNLRCGQDYSVSVVASNKACNSDPSKESKLTSVPCVPTNVKVLVDCSNNQATVSWDASEGALSYTVTAEGGSGISSSCETSALSCVLADLQCGQEYSVQVVSKDDICSSLPSPATLFDSVPCVPDMGSVVMDCVADSFIADWMFSEGAVKYTATALSDNGGQSTCSSNNTNCELSGLQCGQTYSVSVQAENAVCSSASSNAVQATSAPCPAQGVASSLNCSTNSIHVQWQQVSGLEYLVAALGVEEDTAYCSSSSDSCVLKGLECGFIYNISVIASNFVCNTSSSVIQQHSVPCIPQNVRTKFDCEDKDVQVTWQTTKGAHGYRTVAQSLGGFPEACLTNDTWCTFSQLACDMNYTFTVVALDDECSSYASDPVEIYTGPCEPQRVMADMFCHNNTAMVSWEGEGVTSYSVHGYGPDGHAVSCNTEGTSCQLPDMHCGQTYNLTVTANDGRCNNSQTHVSLKSVPCSPTNVGVSLQCYSHIAAVTWEPASGAISYKALAVSADGSHTSVCTNNETHCDLSDLQCGTVYSVTVVGVDSSCSSVESAAATVQTAPCPPQDVVITEQCANGSMTVSWSALPGAQYFLVNGISDSSSVLDCNTTSTSCSFSSLPCGIKYNFIVLAIRGACPSRPSSPVLTSSAPCVPTDINGNLDCVTNAAWISWTNSKGASSYFVFASAKGKAHNASCTSDSSQCNLPDLICGTLYDIQVTAENEHCSSTPSANFELETAACALTSINASTKCDSSVITVQWEMSENMPVYVATAEGHDFSLIMCNSTKSSCQLTSATCGMHYTIIVSTSSIKCSTLRSPPHKIDTAPCAPQNVTAVQSCSNNGVIVSYDLSRVASHYKVEVTGPGFNKTCESTSDSCTLDGLPCGEEFKVVVYALTQNCTSPGTTITYSSGPCPPSGLTVSYDCAGLSATLAWDNSEGTEQYYASAQTDEYTPLYCTSTGLSCTIEGLLCGYNYSFGVEASNNVCNSSSAQPVEAGAVPCSPTNIRVRMQLIEGLFWAMISWDRVTCPDVEYQMVLAGHINDNPKTQMHISSYWLERPYYETPLPTSSNYKINVYARNKAGVSRPSFTETGVTVPSPPQNAVYNKATSELTWDASILANHYRVYTVTGNVETVLCETSHLSCTAIAVDVSSLRVKATNSAGSSLPSVPTAVDARKRRDLIGAEMALDNTLLPPSGVSVKVAGTSLTVKWRTVIDAAEYVVVIDKKIENSQSLIKTTAKTNLIVTGLQPNTEYCLKVAAKNISQQSPYSPIQCISTKKRNGTEV